MKKVTALLAVVMMLTAVQLVSGQVRTFKWSDEMCEYSGTYSLKRYSPQQLRNTARLLRPGEFSIQNTPMVFKPDDIEKLDVEELDREYRQKTRELKALDIVRGAYWQDLRAKMLNEMKQVYELARVTTLGYSDPNRLMEFNGAESCKTDYARPLIAGGDSLLAAWLAVNKESRAKNSDPDRIRRTYEAQLASPDRMKFVVVDVTTFGWWNCANESIQYVDHDGTAEREFRKLFIKVKELGCDEP